MFRLPDMMACSVGYLIPSSQGMSSCLALLKASRCVIPAIRGSTSSTNFIACNDIIYDIIYDFITCVVPTSTAS